MTGPARSDDCDRDRAAGKLVVARRKGRPAAAEFAVVTQAPADCLLGGEHGAVAVAVCHSAAGDRRHAPECSFVAHTEDGGGDHVADGIAAIAENPIVGKAPAVNASCGQHRGRTQAVGTQVGDACQGARPASRGADGQGEVGGTTLAAIAKVRGRVEAPTRRVRAARIGRTPGPPVAVGSGDAAEQSGVVDAMDRDGVVDGSTGVVPELSILVLTPTIQIGRAPDDGAERGRCLRRRVPRPAS